MSSNTRPPQINKAFEAFIANESPGAKDTARMIFYDHYHELFEPVITCNTGAIHTADEEKRGMDLCEAFGSFRKKPHKNTKILRSSKRAIRNRAFETYIAKESEDVKTSARHLYYGKAYEALFGKDDWPTDILFREKRPSRFGRSHPQAILWYALTLVLAYDRVTDRKEKNPNAH